MPYTYMLVKGKKEVNSIMIKIYLQQRVRKVYFMLDKK